MSVRSLSELRDVVITITGSPMPIDAYKAVTKRVEDLESQYLNSLDEAGVSQNLSDIGTDVAPVKLVVTGTTAYKIYVFDFYTDFANATYVFDFVETAPNVGQKQVYNRLID